METNKLLDATLVALQTGDISLLVKEELKYTIQSRRLERGQTELQVDFTESLKYTPTNEEKEKRARRREQNRIAAQRFRCKKKQHCKIILQGIEWLESDNETKRAKVTTLQEEKDKLQKTLNKHLQFCPGINACLRYEP